MQSLGEFFSSLDIFMEHDQVTGKHGPDEMMDSMVVIKNGGRNWLAVLREGAHLIRLGGV